MLRQSELPLQRVLVTKLDLFTCCCVTHSGPLQAMCQLISLNMSKYYKHMYSWISLCVNREKIKLWQTDALFWHLSCLPEKLSTLSCCTYASKLASYPKFIIPAHGRAFVPICTRHGLQDGGFFVALNCPFVVTLCAPNSSLCLLTDKASANSYLSNTHMRGHRQTQTPS